MPVGLTHVSNDLFFQLFLLIPPSISLLCFHCLPFFPVLSQFSHPFYIFHLSFAPNPVFSFHPFLSHPPHPGSSVSGHDESPGDHAATDAADPPAAGSFPPAAPGPAPAAAGCNAAAGTHTHTLMHSPLDKHLRANTLTHADARTPRCKPCPISSRLVCYRCTQAHSDLDAQTDTWNYK